MVDLIFSFFLTATLLFFFSGVSLLIYYTPVVITFSGVWREETKSGSACIKWGPATIYISPSHNGMQVVFKIRRTEIYQIPLQIPPDGGEVQEEIPSCSEEKKPDLSFHRIIPSISLLKNLIPLIFAHIRIERINGLVRFGTGDPVSTGLVYGYYQALAPVCMIFCSAVLIPVFDQLTFEADLTGGFRVIFPLGLIIRSLRRILPDILPIYKIQVPGFKSGEPSV